MKKIVPASAGLGGTKLIQCRIAREWHAQIEALAEYDGASVAGWVTRLLLRTLREMDPAVLAKAQKAQRAAQKRRAESGGDE